MDVKGISLFRSGADFGLMFGAMFVAVFFLALFSLETPSLGFVALAGALLVPCLLYKLLARTYRRMNGLATFSMLWMEGIVVFFCGALVLALAVYVFLRWINPFYITDRLQDLSAFYREAGDEDSVAMADTIDTVLHGHIVPAPIEIAIELIWFTVFSGSVLSMAVAGIIKVMKYKK